MADLTPQQVRHIAKLARLKLSEEEERRFAPELTSILSYIELLNDVPTDGIEATAQVTGKTNALREDTVWTEPIASPDDLLATSPLPITDHQIQTPSAHGGEG